MRVGGCGDEQWLASSPREQMQVWDTVSIWANEGFEALEP